LANIAHVGLRAGRSDFERIVGDSVPG